jgi:hypothetical protein
MQMLTGSPPWCYRAPRMMPGSVGRGALDDGQAASKAGEPIIEFGGEQVGTGGHAASLRPWRPTAVGWKKAFLPGGLEPAGRSRSRSPGRAGSGGGSRAQVQGGKDGP